MDMNTGKVIDLDESEMKERARALALKKTMRDARGEALAKLVPLTKGEAETARELGPKEAKGWMRNKKCHCGSGKKFKKCCLHKHL